MYTFAIVALLGLATVKLVDFACDSIAGLRPMRSLLTFVVAIAGVLALDYSMFQGWNADISDRTLGVWITGFVVAGVTVAWRAVFAYLTHDHATRDETLGEQTKLHRRNPARPLRSPSTRRDCRRPGAPPGASTRRTRDALRRYEPVGGMFCCGGRRSSDPTRP
jgi:hypothetical protein